MKSKFVKIMSVLLVLVLLLCSCGEDKPTTTPDDEPVVTETIVPTETIEATEEAEATDAQTVAPTETTKATTAATVKPTATQTAKPTPTVAPTPTPDPYAKNTYTIKPNLSSIKLVGRTTMVGNYVTCDWSASGIEFTADCKGTVKLKIKGDGGQHTCGYFSVYVDGVKQTNRVQVSTSGTKEVTIATGLKAGEHTFRFLKQTFIKHAKFTIQSISMNGTLAKEAPAQQKYYMEVIGDSITSGHGILEKNGNPSSFDATSAYAFLAAETLKSDYSIVSVDGIGVTKGYQPENMTQVYPYTNYYSSTTKKYTADRQANVVVINLGTNDATKSSNTTQYIKDVKTLIGQVREVYKDVPIVWIYNSMRADYNQYTKTAIDELGGESAGIYMLKFTANTAGGNGHPSAAAHVKDAQDLANFIKSKGFMK